MRNCLTFVVTVAVLVSSTTAGAGLVAAGDSPETTAERVSLDDSTVDQQNATRISSGETYYIGMTLYRDEGIPTDSGINVVEVTDDRNEVRAQVNSDLSSELELDTGDLNLSPGTYALETGDGERVVTFQLAYQELDVEWDRRGADNEGHNTNANLVVDSNRQNYTILLTSQIRHGYEILTGEELQSLVNGTGTPRDIDDDGTNETLAVEGNASTTISFDFENTTSGQFDLTARVPDTELTSSASLDVGTSNAEVNASEVDATLRDNETYYVSQLLYRAEGIEPGMTLEIVDTRGGMEAVEGEVDADYDGELALDTDRLSIGTYELRYQNGTSLLNISLLAHSIDVYTSRSNATNGEVNSTTQFSIDSNWPGATTYLSATRDGETVDATTLSFLLGDRERQLDRDGDGIEETLVIDYGRSETRQVNFEGAPPGIYEFTVSTPATGESDQTVVNVSDSIGLNDPRTPNASRPVSVSLVPEDDEISPGESTTVMVTLNRTHSGVGVYQLSISADDNDTAAIDDVSKVTGDGVMQTNVDDDGTAGEIRATDDGIDGNESNVALATVVVVGESPGPVTVSADIAAIVNKNFESYTVADVENATLEVVRRSTDGVDVTDDGNRSTSVDEDPLHEDLDGDGEFTIVDVQILFEAIVEGDQTVTDNTELFDFTGDDTVTLADVQMLFAELS